MKNDKNLIVVGVSRSGQHFIIEQLNNWKIPYNVYKFENTVNREDEKIKSYNVDLNLLTKRCFIVRDYRNWLASIIKYVSEREIHNTVKSRDERIEYYISLWKDTMKASLLQPNTILINYDNFLDRAYRMYICEKLEGTYDEQNLYKMSEAGGGSSFNNINSLYRYRDILSTEYKEKYLEWYCSDKEAINLNFKLF